MGLTEYRDPIIKALITMFEADGPAELIGHYYYGDTLAPNKSDLPVVAIARDGTQVVSDGTMLDRVVHSFTMSVIYDWTKDLDQSFDLVRGSTALYRLYQEMDDNFTIKQKTLIYALRKNQKLGDNLFISINDNGLLVDYGIGVEKRGDSIFSVEGIVRFNVESTQQKANLY